MRGRCRGEMGRFRLGTGRGRGRAGEHDLNGSAAAIIFAVVIIVIDPITHAGRGRRHDAGEKNGPTLTHHHRFACRCETMLAIGRCYPVPLEVASAVRRGAIRRVRGCHAVPCAFHSMHSCLPLNAQFPGMACRPVFQRVRPILTGDGPGGDGRDNTTSTRINLNEW